MKKFILAGSIIGIVIVIGEGILNGVLLKEQWASMSSSLGIDEPSNMILSLAMFKLFILGFVSIWLYEIFTHKFGPGIKASSYVGLFIAFLIWGWALAGLFMAGYINLSIALPTFIWGFIEIPIAVILGVTIYERAKN